MSARKKPLQDQINWFCNDSFFCPVVMKILYENFSSVQRIKTEIPEEK